MASAAEGDAAPDTADTAEVTDGYLFAVGVCWPRSAAALGGVPVEEAGEPADRVGEVAGRGQRDDAQVVGSRPVESGAIADQDVFLPQELKHDLLVVLDRIDVEV